MLSFFKHLVRYWWVRAALIALLGTAWLLREVRTPPPVGLLDENFIDAARTRTFYEKGTCPPDTLERLYHTAQQRMRQRGLSARHLHDAEENARRQFTQIFQALGYSQCHITFKK